MMQKRRACIATILGLVILAIVLVGVWLLCDYEPETETPRPTVGIFDHAAVSCNAAPCADIALDILKRNGSAVEAAIAALFCEGVASPQSMGLGGGFLMTIYIKETGEVQTLNARETAPAAATRDMYANNRTASSWGGYAAAVPGELRGYAAAFERYRSGNVSWEELVEPAIRIAEDGIRVTAYLALSLAKAEKFIKQSPTMTEVFINNKTGKVFKEGDIIKRPQLAETLKIIRNEGADALHNGSLLEGFVEDIQNDGGILTQEDMREYKVSWAPPVSFELSRGHKLYSSPLPGAGAQLGFTLSILDDTDMYGNGDFNVLGYHRMIEALKYGYGFKTRLGDPAYYNVTEAMEKLTSEEFANETRSQIDDYHAFGDPSHYGAIVRHSLHSHGTAQVSIIAPNGDAVSVTSTINTLFGSMLRSRSTGIIVNNEMDDFSLSVPGNAPEPGKRPLSSMCPTIVTNSTGDVVLALGGTGGVRITSAVAQVTARALWRGQNLKFAIDAPRIHPLLFNQKVEFEKGFPTSMIAALQAKDHNMTLMTPAAPSSAISAVGRRGDTLQAYSDYRRLGVIAGY